MRFKTTFVLVALVSIASHGLAQTCQVNELTIQVSSLQASSISAVSTQLSFSSRTIPYCVIVAKGGFPVDIDTPGCQISASAIPLNTLGLYSFTSGLNIDRIVYIGPPGTALILKNTSYQL